MIGLARCAGAVSLVLVAWVVATPLSASGPRIEGLQVDRAPDRLIVSFHVAGAFSDRALERLAAGLPLVFRHAVELQSKRAVPLWFPKIVARASVVNRVEYDSLTKRFDLSRRLTLDPRIAAGDRVAAETIESTESLDRVREFMSRVDELPLPDPVGPERAAELRLRVEASVGRRYALLFIPTAIRATVTTKVDP